MNEGLSSPDQVARAAAEALGVPAQAVIARERIKGGLTNESWLVSTRDTQVVVRISNGNEEALQIDRRSECRILKLVERAGIGPEVILCQPRDHVLVTRYIAGPVWTPTDAHEPVNIRRIAEVLRRLHAVEVQQDVAITHLPSILENYWATLGGRGVDFASGADREEMREIAAGLSFESPRCLCHNDLHSLNVVDTGRLWLIDWEYAGVGSPWFDLASLCCNHAFTLAESQMLLMHYQDRVDAESLATLQGACRLFSYIRDLWLAVRGG